MFTNEKSDTHKFWLTFIRDVFGIINPEEYIEFEKRVEIEHVKFIDAYVPSTGTIIEQKSPGRDLGAAFIQAKTYHDWLPLSQRGRYIITCDFNELHIHDMEAPTAPPEIILVQEATRDKLSFLLTPGETRPLEIRISVKAGELVKSLYDSLLDSLNDIAREQKYDEAQYKKARDNVNVFCVRLVFLLYAEDSGLFRKSQFHDYLKSRTIMAHDALVKLFAVLKTKNNDRDPYIYDDVLQAFPYVNGGLFDEDVKFPQLNDEVLGIIINDMAEGFDWAGISPVIFGAIFESTLNDETRKQQGMHYTSPENIHKVIDPLFLDGLKETLSGILSEPQSDGRTQKLLAFQDKLAALRFLDPACGSGNFLTESFISLRRMENKLIAAIPEDRKPPVRVSITQFHGIESHDFAVNVARTALWISDHQMWKETQDITDTHDSPLPLKDYHHIKEGSAMDTLDYKGWGQPGWKIPHDDMLYIMGNPPFIGRAKQDKGQKQEVRDAFGNGKVDYVSCWFAVASEYVQDKHTRAAFVATNSIVQGEQAGYVFKPLSDRYGIKIDFAHQTFAWKNELPDPKKMAHVHVVIIGFSTCPPKLRKLYTQDGVRLVENINFYLVEGPDEDLAEETGRPICDDVPELVFGNMPIDGGHLIIEAEDYADFIRREPGAAKFIRRYVGAYEFINDFPRWCLWLVGATPHEIQNMPLVAERVKAVRKFRQESNRPTTRNLANSSSLFAWRSQPHSHYIIVPRVSSEGRVYIPMGFMTPDVIASDAVSIISGATLYHFGVLTSRVHMAWVRRVCGRLKSDYRYSGDMVYNTFAWPTPSQRQRDEIEKTSQAILDARALYPDSSLAELYSDDFMPAELRKAHRENDAAVCRAYGWREDLSEDEIVRELFKLYREIRGRRGIKRAISGG